MKRKLKIIKFENREAHEEKVNEFLEQEIRISQKPEL